jgi:endogenous inhibitor of DNA gyrase (YacG/DUF329 family)
MVIENSLSVPCPNCKKQSPWAGNAFRPFCSERCQLIDLGEWASGQRAIPDDHTPSPETENDLANDPEDSY